MTLTRKEIDEGWRLYTGGKDPMSFSGLSNFMAKHARTFLELAEDALRASEPGREARDAVLEETQRGLFEAIAHGDEKHREWLKAKVDDWFRALKSPSRGSDRIRAALPSEPEK